MRRTRQSGFTLIELVITIIVLAVLAVVSIPYFIELRERNALRGAADNFAAAIGLAKQEAIKRGELVRVEFHAVGDAVPVTEYVGTLSAAVWGAGPVGLRPAQPLAASTRPDSRAAASAGRRARAIGLVVVIASA